MDEVDLVTARLAKEEGFSPFVYDDATDLPVHAPKGKATIGFGCNLESGWSRNLGFVVLKFQVSECAQKLLPYPWYTQCNPVRRSVLLDIEFNDGLGGLLDFKLMLKAIIANDWAEAKAQCQVRNPELKSRYDTLGELLLIGSIAG